MTLLERDGNRFGESPADIIELIQRYSRSHGYEAQQFAEAECACGHKTFKLHVDDVEGAAIRVCTSCQLPHPIGDSEEYLADAELEECACPCGREGFEISMGLALYEGTEDVRWLYLGCRCQDCGLTAVYADWKNEFNGYKKLLAGA